MKCSSIFGVALSLVVLFSGIALAGESTGEFKAKTLNHISDKIKYLQDTFYCIAMSETRVEIKQCRKSPGKTVRRKIAHLIQRNGIQETFPGSSGK